MSEHAFNFRGLTPARATYPVAASTLIERGNIVCLDVNGRAVEGGTVAAGALQGIGRALAKTDNSSGAAGDIDCEVELGVFEWLNSSGDPLTQADVGHAVFVESEATVARTSSGATLPNAGTMTEITKAGKIAVHMTLSSSAGAISAEPQKRTVVIPESALTAAATTQTLSVGAVLPANSRILGVTLDGYVPFTGGTVSAMKIDVGSSGDIQALVKQADAFAAAVDGQTSTCPAGNSPNKFFAAATQLQAKFTATGDNVVNCTAGTVTVTVLFAVLA